MNFFLASRNKLLWPLVCSRVIPDKDHPKPQINGAQHGGQHADVRLRSFVDRGIIRNLQDWSLRAGRNGRRVGSFLSETVATTLTSFPARGFPESSARKENPAGERGFPNQTACLREVRG
jgi:hypothetical protein